MEIGFIIFLYILGGVVTGMLSLSLQSGNIYGYQDSREDTKNSIIAGFLWPIVLIYLIGVVVWDRIKR